MEMATIGFKNELKNVVISTEHFALCNDGRMFSKGFYTSGNGYAFPIVTKFDTSRPAGSSVWQHTGEEEAWTILFHAEMRQRGAKWAVEFPPFVLEWARKAVNAN